LQSQPPRIQVEVRGIEPRSQKLQHRSSRVFAWALSLSRRPSASLRAGSFGSWSKPVTPTQAGMVPSA